MLENGRSAVAEELIVQAPEMACFHPQSVNTVRFASFYDHDTFTRVMCVFRMGMDGNVVDNGGAGGICASVDPLTGVCVGPGTRENGERYQAHPNTGEQIVGFRIPHWEELIAIVEELVKVIPEQKYVGWDMALTEAGWMLVEANAWGQFEIGQMSDKQGLRDVISNTFGRVIYNQHSDCIC